MFFILDNVHLFAVTLITQTGADLASKCSKRKRQKYCKTVPLPFLLLSKLFFLVALTKERISELCFSDQP